MEGHWREKKEEERYRATPLLGASICHWPTCSPIPYHFFPITGPPFSCTTYSQILKMEAAGSFQKLLSFYQTTQDNITEDTNLHTEDNMSHFASKHCIWLYTSQNQHQPYLAVHISYHSDKKEKLKLFPIFWSITDCLCENVLQRRDRSNTTTLHIMAKWEQGHDKTWTVGTIACLLKARIVKPAETAVARERLCKHPLLCNNPTDNNGGTVGSSVFSAVHPKGV
jgi:hypothetical protein